MESQNWKILCSTGKTHEQGFETGKWNPQTGKFFFQPEKPMNRDLKPEKDISVTGKLLSQRERTI